MTPLLPLDSWRRIMGFNPWHFWGFAGTTGAARVTSGCNDVLKQYAWQDADKEGRAELLEAIEHAEYRLRSLLGFGPAPRYVVETLPWPRYSDAALFRYTSSDSRGQRVGIQTSEGYIQAAGVETRTLIGNANVTYSDVDSDGLNDTATISIATSVTDTAQIAVYIATADRFDGSSVSERWRIQPLTVSISAGTATIKGPAWLFGKPVLYEGISTADLNPATASNFVTTVDVYRRYTDPDGETVDNAQATLIWETSTCAGWYCCGSSASYTPTDSSADPAAVAKAVARVGIRDSRVGIVTPAQAVRNATSGIWSDARFDMGYEPDRVTVRYLAGVPLEDGHMAQRWQTIVARLAAAELARPICACDKVSRELYKWQFDMSRAAGSNDEQYSISPEDLNNPLGHTRGHIYAWREVKNLRHLIGFLP